MNRHGLRVWAALAVVAITSATVCAQDPNQELIRRIDELSRKMEQQKVAFEGEIKRLNEKLDDAQKSVDDESLNQRIDAEIGKQLKLYRRPLPGQTTPTASLFNTQNGVPGGMFFTGLFRTRFELRTNNVDFNGDESGLDDTGARFNGRFRLGFGAALFDNAATAGQGRQITAFTEFQSYGSFANSSYLRLSSAQGATTPQQFDILTEPFKSVGLYQGYLLFQQVIDDAINVKVGRQELAFGNEMILGANSFFGGTVHDSVLAELNLEEGTGFVFSAMYAKESAADNSIISVRSFNEDEFAAFYLQYGRRSNFQFDAYAVWFNAQSGVDDTFVTGSTAYVFDNAFTPPILGRFWTLGARAFGNIEDFFGGVVSLNGEGAVQFGRDTSALTPAGPRDIRGFAGEFSANWRMDRSPDSLKPILSLGYYYAGGGGHGLNRDIGFQPLFINRHFEALSRTDRDNIYKPYHSGGGRYGNMDEIPLTDIHIGKASFSVAVADGVEIGASYLAAFTADDTGYGAGYYGQELDLFASYIYSENLQFGANVSAFIPGKTANAFSNLLFFDPLVPTSGPASETAFAIYFQALISF